MEQERSRFPGEEHIATPQFMKEVIAEITALARRSSDINQRSGVSVRVSIANYETVISNALRRSIVLREKTAVPRITDLPYILASFSGKVELETFEDGREAKVMENLTKRAVLNVFGRYFSPEQLEGVLQTFDEGVSGETGSQKRSKDYVKMVERVDGLSEAVSRLVC